MTLSGQGAFPTNRGRVNQKARTRTALLQAAAELVREGMPPSVPEAADRALVSVATAYRYFSSGEDLWWEASNAAISGSVEEVELTVEAAGDDSQARLEALIRGLGFQMLEDQVPFRRITLIAQEQWFHQGDASQGERVPTREGSNAQIRHAIAPLRSHVAKKDLDRIAHALGLVVGSEAMISLIDAVGLDVPTAKKTLLNAARWLLAGALAELTDAEAE